MLVHITLLHASLGSTKAAAAILQAHSTPAEFKLGAEKRDVR